MKTVSGHSRVLKIAALALTFALAQGGLLAQTVNIPDPNLKAVIREALQKPSGDITVADMESLILLDADGRGIRNLTGLEKASNVTDLILGGGPQRRNQITDLSPLAGLTNLTGLVLDGNQVSDLSSLVGLTNLEDLNLQDNQVTDISQLAGLTNLEGLSLGGNQISDLSPLGGLNNLTGLGLDGNQVTDLSPLAGLIELTRLDLWDNQISDLSPLAGLIELTWLHLWGNQITDLSPLAGMTELTWLTLRDNQVTDLSPLAGLVNLTWLDLRNCAITELSPLAGPINLTILILSDNHISDLSPLAGFSNLEILALDNNLITDIGALVGLTNLRGWGFLPGLDLRHNYIDIDPGSPARQVIDSLSAIEGLIFEYEPQGEPLMGGMPIAGQEDWYRSDWWGTYCTTFAPWVYHTEHGFIYRNPSSTTESLFVYDEGLDTWCWTNEEVYPAVYAFNPGADNQGVNIGAAWLWYFKDTRTPRSFRVLTGASATQTLFFGP